MFALCRFVLLKTKKGNRLVAVTVIGYICRKMISIHFAAFRKIPNIHRLSLHGRSANQNSPNDNFS